VEPLSADDPERIVRFTLLGRLGAGGMGRVYLARVGNADGEQVAIKVIRPEFAFDETFRARFRREVEAAGTVPAEYTAAVVDADPDGSPPWLATRFVEGRSLDDEVAARGPLPASEVVALARGLATALTAIHGLGLVHRDLKPSNVLLAPDGPRLIDFGIAQTLDATRLTHTGHLIGTPSFMSPDQVLARGQVGPASDIFSFGGVLVFAATGRGPFDGPSVEAVMYRIVHEAPDLDGVPEPVRDLVERCLVKEPGGRPRAAEVLTALRTGVPLPRTVAATDAAPTVIRPEPPPTRRRRRGLIAAALVAVVALVTTAFIALRPDPPDLSTMTALERALATGAIRIAVTANPAPAYEATTAAELKLATAVLNEMGIAQVEPVLLSKKGHVEGLNARSYDMIASGFMIDAWVCDNVDVSLPVHRQRSAFLVPRGNPHQVQRFEDVVAKNLRLALVGGWESGYASAAGLPEELEVTADTPERLLELVVEGSADAAALGDVPLRNLLSRNPDAPVEITESFTATTGGVPGEIERAFAFRSVDADLRKAFDAELTRMLDSGEWLQIVEPYGFTEANRPLPVLNPRGPCDDL
jgi:ABC-type amino acid transport substrate-binding protein